MTLMTHKYRGSQQSLREVKPKFIDLTQGQPKCRGNLETVAMGMA
jgi:hypothetical protein